MTGKTFTAWAAVLLTILLAAQKLQAEVLIEVYTRPGCPHCEEARQFLAALERERSDVTVLEHDVTRDSGALGRLRDISALAGIRTPGVPTFVIGTSVLVGFDPGGTPERITGLLAPRATTPEPTAAPGATLQLPLLGPVDVDQLGLPLFTVLVGLVDGFNPCAMWVLLFLLAMLVNLKSRPRMALIAGTFVAVSGIVYFTFMAAWLTVFMLVGISSPVRITLALLALLMGGLNLKDALFFRRGPSLGIPEAAKPGIYRQVRRILSAENLTGAMLGIVVLALLVNMVELLCTAGLPALYTAILTSRSLPEWQYYAYLALYIGAYVLDDALMVTIAVFTLGRRKLQERSARWLKLLSGLVIGGLGLLLLLAPAWLGF